MVVRSSTIAACRTSNGTRLKFKQWNKKSCGIFYREIRRKATDKEGQRKKWRKGSRYGSLFYRQRVTLRHKSYSVGRDTLAWPLLQETIPQPPRFITMWIPASTFYSVPTDYLPGRFYCLNRRKLHRDATCDKFDAEENVQNQRNKATSARWSYSLAVSSGICVTFYLNNKKVY